MAPERRECPTCHATSDSSASQCSACLTPFPLSDTKATREPHPDDNATFVNGAPADENATFAGDEKPGNRLSAAAAAGWSQPVAVRSEGHPRSGRLVSGSHLGKRYEIVQVLGQGGMGAVYKARDLELDRLVALKVMRPELAAHEEILQRFKQELILARKITHKNVIRIFDLGEIDGIKFITMEFIEGKDLNSLIREKGRLSFEESADVIFQVCAALDAAHSEGVVHRDLKPQNIMVEKSGRVIVMDFGIARTMEQGGGMTHTGALLGTPDYMSPEQVMGEHVDARSDLFALGIIFFQLLVGQLPYKAATVQGAMYKRTRESSRAPSEVDAAVPALLSDIAVKCLQLDRSKRYQSAVELQRDIEAWRGGSTKRIDIHAGKEEPLPARRRSRAALLAGVAALVMLAAGGGFVVREYMRPSARKPGGPVAPLNSLAILPFHNGSSDPKLDWLGSSMAEMLSTDVGQSTSVRMTSSDRVGQVLRDLRITPQSGLDPGTVGRIANLSNVDTVVWGSYVQAGDRIRFDATVQDLKRGHTTALKEEAANEKDILPAVDRLAAQIRRSLSVSGSLLKELQQQAFKPSTTSLAALKEYDQGLQQARAGNHAAAADDFQVAIHEDGQFALAYAKLAQSYAEMGHDDEAEQASQKALTLSATLSGQEKYLIQASHNWIVKDYPKAIEAYQNLAKVSPNNTDYLLALGQAYRRTAEYEKAKQAFERVVELDPKRVEGLLALGQVKIESGDMQGSLESLTRAQSLSIELGDDAQRAQIMQAIGVAYESMSRYEEALKSLQESLEIKQRLGMKRGIAQSLEEIASIQYVTGKPEQALKHYNQALSLMRDVGDKDGTAGVLNDLGAAYKEQGKYDEALKLFKQSLQLRLDLHDEASQGLALSNIGSAYQAKGDFENARTYFAQALQVREKLKVPGDIADTLHNLAETSAKTGQFDQAEEQYLRAMELRRSSGDQRGAAIESSGLGTLFADQGRYGAALSAQQDALKTFQASKEQGYMATETLLAYGNALALLGRGEEAAKSLTEALNTAREQKSEEQIATALNYEGDNADYRGDLKTAAGLYEQALQVASKTGNEQMVLRTKVNQARLALEQGRYPATLTALKGLGEQADTLGLKYVSVDCMVLRGKAMIGTKDYAGAQKELKSAVLRSEKLGLKVLLAQAHYQLGRALQLDGKAAEGVAQVAEARRLAAEVRKEAKSDDIKKRADLAPLFAEASS